MGINLDKGGRVALGKDDGHTKFIVGLGWNANPGTGATYDLDASAFGCAPDAGGDPHLIGDDYFIYYRNLNSPCGGITHSGDNLTGDGDGDDEQIVLDLSKVPAHLQEIACMVTIYDAASKGQNFGQVRAAYIRIVDAETNVEVARYDLTEDYHDSTAIQFGSVYKKSDGSWAFKAIGQGFNTDLRGLLGVYAPNAQVVG
jgi:tellurium resistance protein TerD